MLPTLLELEIEPPIYIRKIDSRSKWNPEGCGNNLMERARIASELLFKDPDNLYSLWLINTDKDFYGVLAALSANRNSTGKHIDFICIKDSDLRQLNINYVKAPEGKCFLVQSLHFNASIDEEMAARLCYILMEQGIEAKRCSKQNTQLILEHQLKIGCKATKTTALLCDCEL